MGKEFNDLTCEELCDLMCGAPEEEEKDYSEDFISRAEAQKHIYTRLYESALNNVGYECKATDVFTDIAENRLSTWISEIPSIYPMPKASCNICKHYRGAHGCMGHAPCSYHKISGVLWDCYCSQFEPYAESEE
jgi:hypothetical protein